MALMLRRRLNCRQLKTIRDKLQRRVFSTFWEEMPQAAVLSGEADTKHNQPSREFDMRQITRKLVCGGLAALAGLFAVNQADATDYYAPSHGHSYHRSYTHTHHVQYRRVVEYTTRRVAYTDYVTQYDDCGRAYQVTVTRWRTESVPVVRWVAVRGY
jgi:hypothetical protein